VLAKTFESNTPISWNIVVYTNTPSNFQNNLKVFQIHKSPGRNAFVQGFCCLLGQLAGEKLRHQCATATQTLCRVKCSTPGDRGYLGTLILDEIRSGLPPYGEVECALSAVSRHKAKSRQRTGSRSSKPPTSWSQVIGIAQTT